MRETRRSIFLIAAACLAQIVAGQTAPEKKGSEASSIVGNWKFDLDTEGGPRTAEAEFKLDGSTVSGTWNKTTPVKGTFADGKLELEFPYNSDEVGPGTFKISGKLGEGLEGSWSFQTYSGSFKAARTKAPN